MTQDASAGNGAGPGSRFARQWNYRPAEPISTSPLFQWPLNPASIGRWFAARWLVFGENLIILGLAVVTWHFVQPSLEVTRTLGFSWIAQTFLRNMVLITLVAGGLHWLLHSRKIQGNRLKFDPQDMKSGERRFTLNSQLLDNMLWTLTSGVFFWTAFEALMLWAMANGYAPMLLWT